MYVSIKPRRIKERWLFTLEEEKDDCYFKLVLVHTYLLLVQFKTLLISVDHLHNEMQRQQRIHWAANNHHSSYSLSSAL